MENRSKLALKDQVKPKQEYPCVLLVWLYLCVQPLLFLAGSILKLFELAKFSFP